MRHRNMFYLTGLPGWMRFGYSPGWGGLPPGAQFLMTGQWPTPQMQAAWQAMQAGQPVGPSGTGPWGMMQPDRATQLEFLNGQLGMLSQQVEAVKQMIADLEQESE